MVDVEEHWSEVSHHHHDDNGRGQDMLFSVFNPDLLNRNVVVMGRDEDGQAVSDEVDT